VFYKVVLMTAPILGEFALAVLLSVARAVTTGKNLEDRPAT
jgi:hypothetical protein